MYRQKTENHFFSIKPLLMHYLLNNLVWSRPETAFSRIILISHLSHEWLPILPTSTKVISTCETDKSSILMGNVWRGDGE